MTWIATAAARPWVTDGPGWCLRYTQSFFGAPAAHRSATEAWNATTRKHGPSEPLPDVPCILWFAHWGAYGEPLSYENWGHVTPYIPGDAIYSSPAGNYWGYERYETIADIEAAFNCQYVGWSEDINGLSVCEQVNTPATPAKPIKPERKVVVGTFQPSASKRQSVNPAKRASDRTTVKINTRGDTSLLGSSKKAQVTASVWVQFPKSEAGKSIELTLFADRFYDGGTKSRRGLHSVTQVIPADGLIRAQITAGVSNDKVERTRLTVRNDTARKGSIIRVAWDIFK